MLADNRAHLLAAAAQRSAETRQRAVAAVRHLDQAGQPITFTAVAAAAGISRSWLYRNADIRAEIDQLRTSSQHPSSPPVPAADRSSDASLRQRLDALLADNQALREDNAKLRQQVAELLGQQRAAAAARPASPKTIGPCS